jgi:hypothetical protein
MQRASTSSAVTVAWRKKQNDRRSTVIMKSKFILALAFLVGAAMTPYAHTQDQSSPTSNATSAAKSATNKTKKGAQNTASGAKSATNGAASQAGSAASSTKNATGNAANSAKNATTNGTSTAKNAGAATPPSPGMVWANTSTKVYHTSGSKYYGNTKSGKWMTQADAQKAGYKQASN